MFNEGVELVKAIVMKLLFSAVLSFAAAVYGQDTSNGGQPLPNKTVALVPYPDCTVSDSMHTFFNDRATQCNLFSTFKNGEKRFLQAGDGFLYTISTLKNVFGQTSCATAVMQPGYGISTLREMSLLRM